MRCPDKEGHFLCRSPALLPVIAALLIQQAATPSPALDYDFFKARVQPIFTAKRPATRAVFRVMARARRCVCSRSRRAPRPGARRTRARTSSRSSA